MADVLLVFVREDRVFGDGLRQSLETSGLNVVRCENEFDHNNPAPCILILWSAVSTRSGTLREIAAHAQRDGRLVSARLDNCEAPPSLTRTPPFDLSQWSGDPDDQAIDPIFFAVDRLVMAKARRRESAPAALPQAPPANTSYEQPGRPRLDKPPPASPVTSNYAPIGRRQPDAAPVRAGPIGGRPPVAAPPPSQDGPPSLAEEALAWRAIEHSNDPTDYLNFLQDFGAHGTFAELAQFKLDKLTKAGKPQAHSFIQHKPSPHVEAPKPRPAPPPQRAAAPPAEPREAPQQWREPPPQERIAAAELEPSSRSRRSVSGRPRRRVAEQAMEAPMRHEPRRGAPWAPILFAVLLAGGGFAYFQMQPKKAETAEAPQAETAAPENERAAPSQLEEPAAGNRTTLAAAYERAGPLAAAPNAPARAAAAPRERQVASATTAAPAPENRAYSPTISYQPPATETPAPAAPSFTAPPTVIAPQPQPQPQPTVAAPPPTPTPAPAAAPAAASNYPVVIWEQQPSNQNRIDAYPSVALQRGVGGQAMLDCEILPTTRLNCVVQSETPSNLGFGRAALQLAPRFKAVPVAADGKPVIGKRVKIPVRFQAPR